MLLFQQIMKGLLVDDLEQRIPLGLVLKKSHDTQGSLNKWKLRKGLDNRGENWMYTRDDDNSDEYENFTNIHSGEWFISEKMHGFCVTITQQIFIGSL